MARPLTRAERRHFLVRTGFGASPREDRELAEMGLDNQVERILVFRYTVLEQRALFEFIDPSRPDGDEITRWWLHLMTRTDQPFRELLAFYWHDHFATSQRKLPRAGLHLMVEHVRMLRGRAVGSLRDLLRDVLVDPAMQIWLDGVGSSKTKPNENLAREYWERFSLGVDNGYTQEDIREASRALTGFVVRRDTVRNVDVVEFDPQFHDDGEKTIFGQTGRFTPSDVADLTIDQRPVARYIAHELFRWFCYDDPPAAVVDELARVLRENDYQLRPLLRTILRSEAFFSDRSLRGRIKSPVEFLVGFSRTTGLDVPMDALNRNLGALKQRPTWPPHVGGWTEGLGWVSDTGMIERSNGIVSAISERQHQARSAIDVESLLPDDDRSAEGVVEG